MVNISKVIFKVGSVVQVSTVQNDPSVGCAKGFMLVQDYAPNGHNNISKVTQEMFISSYECDSQKIRVCEYTVLKVTDATDEHKMFHPDPEDFEDYEEYEEYESEDYLTLDEAKELLDSLIYV